MDMKMFLEELETNDSASLLGEGKQWNEIPEEFKDALKRQGVTNPKFAYKPDDYDLVVYQLKEDGSAPGSWGVAFMTEAEFDDEEEEDLFGESKRIFEAEDTGMTVVGQPRTGNFLDIVQLCIEVASNDSYKKGFTPSNIKQAITKAK